MNTMKKHDIGLLQLGVVSFFSFVVLTFFSPPTSWLFGNARTFDSNTFPVIGKYWDDGESLPYRDLWDLKGPVIFFVNALGYWLAGGKVGVFFIQFVSLSLSSIVALRMLRGGGTKSELPRL